MAGQTDAVWGPRCDHTDGKTGLFQHQGTLLCRGLYMVDKYYSYVFLCDDDITTVNYIYGESQRSRIKFMRWDDGVCDLVWERWAMEKRGR